MKIRNEKTQLAEEPVHAHERPCHPRGQKSVDSRLRQEGYGVAASQAQAVQHHLQEDHVQLVRPVQVVRAKGEITCVPIQTRTSSDFH